MIITWFTDPSDGHFAENPGKFSSYYQYDTATRNLVRVRLELGRESHGEDAGEPSAFLYDKRYIGFSKVDYCARQDEFPDDVFTIDTKNGRVLVKKEALSVRHSVGDFVVDISIGDHVPHFGTKVSYNANLPEGISIKHLRLIANEAIITNRNIEFTKSTATGVDLSSILKAKICDIVGKKDFATVSDEDILTKLKAQVTEIKTTSVAHQYKELIDKSIKEVEDVVNRISGEIAEGRITINTDFLKAFDSFKKSIEKAKTEIAGEGNTDTVEILSTAKASLLASAETLESEQKSQTEGIFNQFDEAIEAVQSESRCWEIISNEYKEAKSAKTIEDYEERIRIIEEKSIELL